MPPQAVTPDFWSLFLGYGPMGAFCLILLLVGGKKLDQLTDSISDLTIMVAMSLIDRLDENELAKGVAQKTIEKIKERRSK